MNKIDKAKNIVFIGSPQEFDDYDNYVKQQQVPVEPNDEIIVSMTPIARAHGEELGYRSNSTMPYFSEESHKSVSKKAEEVAEWLRDQAEFVDPDIEAKEFLKNAFIFYIRLVINYCVSIIEIITNAIDMHDPIMLKASLKRKNSDSLYIKEEEKYLGVLGDIVARSRGVRFEPFADPGLYMKGVLNRIFNLSRIAIKRADFLFWVKKISKRDPKRRPIIFATTHYQMDKLLEDFKKNLPGHPFYVLKSPPLITFRLPQLLASALWGKRSGYIKRQTDLFENLEHKIIDSSSVFSYKGIAFTSILLQKLRDSIYNYVIGEMLWSTALNDFLDKVMPAAIFCSGNRMDDTLMAGLCKRKKITTILISHGSLVRPKNEYERIEWGEQGMVLTRMPFDILALQTPLSEGYLEAFPSGAKILKTGPLIWGTAVDKNVSQKVFNDIFGKTYGFKKVKVVTHVSSPKSYRDFRPFIYETLDEYIDSVENLAKAVEGMSGVVLVVRFRPRPEISVEALKRLIPFSKKVILNNGGSFNTVLSISDLIVSFSSTAIEEALQNNVPVLLYGGGGRYQHIPSCDASSRDAIKKAAICHVKDDAYLKDGLNAMLFRDKVVDQFSPYIYPASSRSSIVDVLKKEIAKCSS